MNHMPDAKEEFEQMKRIAELAPCGIGVFDLQTAKPVFLNKAYYALIRYTQEEYAEIANDFDYLLVPEDRPIAHDGRGPFFSAGKVDGGEYRIESGKLELHPAVCE